MLVGLNEILDIAEKKNFCIPAFNVYNLETVKGVINQAEKLKAPVILQMYSRLVTSKVAEHVAPIIIEFANRAKVPVAFHLDHGAGKLEVVRSIKMGMTGIMYDGSQYSFEENIKNTKEVVELCNYVDVGVEGELGHVGKAALGDENVVTEYTHPDEAFRYVKETGVSALAIMVGTAHGRYKKAPVLDIDRIKEIKDLCNIPLVLHGGSGVPDDQIRMAIKAGIRKMNFSTDLCYSFLDGCRERDKSIVAIDLFMEGENSPISRVEEFAMSKIKVLDAEGKV